MNDTAGSGEKFGEIPCLASARVRDRGPVELPEGSTDGTSGEMVHVPGGEFVMGTDDRVRALDNERGAHFVDVPAFFLDKTPVTNAAYIAFIEDGGYENREFWDSVGWEYIKKENIAAPKHWYQPEPHSWCGIESVW